MAMANSLMAGRRHSCACFGAASTPISWSLVLRNLALIAVTIFAAIVISMSGRSTELGLAALLAVVAVAEATLVWCLGRFLSAGRYITVAGGGGR